MKLFMAVCFFPLFLISRCKICVFVSCIQFRVLPHLLYSDNNYKMNKLERCAKQDRIRKRIRWRDGHDERGFFAIRARGKVKLTRKEKKKEENRARVTWGRIGRSVELFFFFSFMKKFVHKKMRNGEKNMCELHLGEIREGCKQKKSWDWPAQCAWQEYAEAVHEIRKSVWKL